VIVAAPVVEHAAGRTALVAGANRHAAYVDLDGFIVALTAPGTPLMPNGAAGGVSAPGTRVTFDFEGAQVWDPTLRLGDDPARRGTEILTALGTGVPDDVIRAIETRDPERLLGRGPGLTPEGDDYLAAIVAVAGWPRDWLPPDLRRRTTALSATLLELATEGQVVEPLQALTGPRWRGALHRLLAFGHSTGRAYAVGAAAAISLHAA
jgi:Protein of unknown function (DUF2877)